MNPQRWNLKDLFTDPSLLDGELEDLQLAVRNFESHRSDLHDDLSPAEFSFILDNYENLSRKAQRLSGYANLWFYEDTQDPQAVNLRSRINQILAEASTRTFFFELWVKGIPEENAERLLQASGERRYYLEALRLFQPYTLTEPEEKIVTLKDVNGIDALMGVYEMVTNRFSFSLDVEGELKTLTRDGLMAYVHHPSAEMRAQAYQELYRVFTHEATLLAQIYTHRVQDWYSEGLLMRKFPSPISVRNLLNDIPDEVVETMLAVCRQNVNIFQDYFRLKARWLGLKKLRRYDIYAPLSTAQKEYSFGEAVDLVLTSFSEFSPHVADSASLVIQEGHLDSELRPGKRGGAFCYSVLPDLTPWVLVNFAGKGRDVTTLAHELGHAVHALLSKEHSVLTYNPSLPLAETASVFSEMLLTEKILALETDIALRRELLAHAIDDAYATIMRQAFFTIFEREAHAQIVSGSSVEEICDLYQQTLTEQFGDAVELSDEFRWEWVSIPHFYRTPFYTYAYSFGQLLVLALYQEYRNQGEAFIPGYLKILSAGGSNSPLKILEEAGIDATAPAFWQGGFDVLAGMIQRLESL